MNLLAKKIKHNLNKVNNNIIIIHIKYNYLF